MLLSNHLNKKCLRIMKTITLLDQILPSQLEFDNTIEQFHFSPWLRHIPNINLKLADFKKDPSTALNDVQLRIEQV